VEKAEPSGPSQGSPSLPRLPDRGLSPAPVGPAPQLKKVPSLSLIHHGMHWPAHRCLHMPVDAVIPLNLRCPSCGRTGHGTISQRSPEPHTAEVSSDFRVQVGANAFLRIECRTCGKPVCGLVARDTDRTLAQPAAS